MTLIIGCSTDLEGGELGNHEIGAAPSHWHILTQEERNQKILNRAFNDLEDDVGLNCNRWIRKVVIDASDGAVDIPNTNNS